MLISDRLHQMTVHESLMNIIRITNVTNVQFAVVFSLSLTLESVLMEFREMPLGGRWKKMGEGEWLQLEQEGVRCRLFLVTS